MARKLRSRRKVVKRRNTSRKVTKTRKKIRNVTKRKVAKTIKKPHIISNKWKTIGVLKRYKGGGKWCNSADITGVKLGESHWATVYKVTMDGKEFVLKSTRKKIDAGRLFHEAEYMQQIYELAKEQQLDATPLGEASRVNAIELIETYRDCPGWRLKRDLYYIVFTFLI